MARHKARQRGAYRPEAATELARIEKRRLELDISRAELAGRVGLTERTVSNMFRDGRAFPRHTRALSFALRTIERERQAEQESLR